MISPFITLRFLLNNIGISTGGSVLRIYFRKVEYILLPYARVIFGKSPHVQGKFSFLPRSFNVSAYLFSLTSV